MRKIKTDIDVDGNVNAKSVSANGIIVGLTYVGEIKMFAGSTAPSGWLICDGASLLRASYPALFSLIGTNYGSADGTHFNIPDLRDRNPIGVSGSNALASNGGADSVVLGTTNLPAHSHAPIVSTSPVLGQDTPDSTFKYLGIDGAAGAAFWVAARTSPVTTDSGNTASVGNGTAVATRDKFLAVNFIIATSGV